MQEKLANFLNSFSSAAKAEGELLMLVGGYLRDLKILGQEGRDIDLLYTGDAIDFALKISSLSNKSSYNNIIMPAIKVKEIFEPFHTAKIEVEGLEEYDIELASTRTETYPCPAAFPDVELCSDEDRMARIAKDLPRRDFTINTLVAVIATTTASHPEHSEGSLSGSMGILRYAQNDGCHVQDDTINAEEDIAKKQIRVFHDNSFIDDPTRVYRAVRFAAKLGFKFEANTYEVMRAACRDPRFPEWLQKRKNRFNIELDLIESLEPAKAKIARDLLAELLPPK